MKQEHEMTPGVLVSDGKIPDVLVPSVATREMKDAALAELERQGFDCQDFVVQPVYQAMLSAAPAPVERATDKESLSVDQLWAVHAQGPDELYPAFNRDDAEKHAAALNALSANCDIKVSAVVVESPWPHVDHWKYLAEQEREHAEQFVDVDAIFPKAAPVERVETDKRIDMWGRIHDLAVSKGYDHVLYAVECAPVYKCDCMGARKVALDLDGNTMPCECVTAANDTTPQPSPAHAAPDVAGLVEAAHNALREIEAIMHEAYNSAEPVCCGRPGLECCGDPAPEWSDYDQRMMDRLAPHQRALNAALAAHQHREGE